MTGFKNANTSIDLTFTGISVIVLVNSPLNNKKALSTKVEKKLAPVKSCNKVNTSKLNLKAVATVDHIPTAQSA